MHINIKSRTWKRLKKHQGIDVDFETWGKCTETTISKYLPMQAYFRHVAKYVESPC